MLDNIIDVYIIPFYEMFHKITMLDLQREVANACV